MTGCGTGLGECLLFQQSWQSRFQLWPVGWLAREFVMAAEGGVQGSRVGAGQPGLVEATGRRDPACGEAQRS